MIRGCAIAVLVAGILVGCGGRDARPLVVGQDSCEYCRMAISDDRFGGEAVLTTGRHHTFDAIECLAAWLATADFTRIAAIYVSDFESHTLVDAPSAVFIQGGSQKSPMGRDLIAFAARPDHAGLVAKYGGQVLDWTAVRRLASTPVRARSHGHAHEAPGSDIRAPAS
jgi:copper chaperone NosL